MIVSTKGRYALRVMIDLAEHQSEKYVPLKEVAARQEISEKYLENILKVLVQNGFLEGLRGKGGGYRLTRSPDQYTVSEILMLTEGSLAPVSCLTPGASACARMANCRTYEMWKGLNDLISDYFGKITLACWRTLGYTRLPGFKNNRRYGKTDTQGRGTDALFL